MILFFSCKSKFENEYWPNGASKTKVSVEKYLDFDSLYVLKHYELNSDIENSYTFEKYYSNSKMESRGKFINGEKDGKWEHWYQNGQKSLEENFSYGRKISKYQSWFPNGDVLEVIEYSK